MKYKHIKQIFCGLLIITIIYSCGNKQQVAGEQSFELNEEKLPNTITFSQIPDSVVNLSDEIGRAHV